MVLYGSEFPGNDYPPPDPEPNGGGIGEKPPASGGCGAGMVETGLDAQGKPMNGRECVSIAEADRRTTLAVGPMGGVTQEPGKTPGAGGGGTPRPGSYAYDPGAVPQFKAPAFTFNEQFRYPSFEEAQNEPGYRFRLDSGLGALQNSAAARGTLRSGATLKGLNDYAQNFASQEYGNVANRSLQGFQTRRDTAQQAWENLFRGAQAEYAPNLVGWQTRAQLGDNGLNRQWDAWRYDNLSAADILAALGR
jgi:hypothetical protein